MVVDFDPQEPSLRATVESLNRTRLVYEPEARTKYSNAGVAVVGYALERHPMIGHGGAVYGFSTQLHALPDQKLGVVAVAAKDGANGPLQTH